MSISYPGGILFAVFVLSFYMMKVGLKKVIT